MPQPLNTLTSILSLGDNMKRQLPPKSIRYCAHCKDETTFKYDRNIGHSRCTECGWHYIPSLDITGQYAKEKEAFEKAREEKKTTPEYLEKKKQRDIEKQKQREMKLLTFSREALGYRQRSRRKI